MLTGDIRNQIERIWEAFCSGGTTNPEQITYLRLLKRLDEVQELEEQKATALGKPITPRLPRRPGPEKAS